MKILVVLVVLLFSIKSSQFYFSLEWSKLVAEFPIASSRKGSRLERTEPKLNSKLDVKLGLSLFRAQAYIGKFAQAWLVDSPIHAD
uniref:Uncharacterized protein n=1 Tax=Oryza rufipogon TaxID=4529 RepID=A0A0E0RGZ9_ORYRU